MTSKSSMFARRGWVVLALLALWGSGLAVRRFVYRAQCKELGFSPPFTLESALYFRRIRQVFETGRIPAFDPDIQYPDGIVPAEADTVGAEYVFALLARAWPKSVPLAERIRWIEAGWFCLGIPLLAVWIRACSGSWLSGWIAALFYAVGASSVIRSTGQELLHENFALPFVVLHLAADAWAARMDRRRLLAIAISSLALALALMNWDLVQVYVLGWSLVWVFRLASGRGTSADVQRWAGPFLALCVAGAVNPYLRSHGFLFSGGMLFSYGLCVVLVMARRNPELSPLGRVVLLFIPVALGLYWGSTYRSAYGHFAELLVAKLLHANRKPADPAQLTFEARILWTPGLDSADLGRTVALFPLLLLLTLGACGVLLLSKSHRRDPVLAQLLVFCLGALLLYVLFVRFHVWVSLFAAGLVGWATSCLKGHWVRRWPLALVLAAAGAEAAHTLDNPQRWGRRDVYFAELEELAAWLRANVRPEPVLASFGLSPTVLTYGECPILLHPKFESPEARDRVRAYGEKLFRGSERELRDWADRYGARWLVYGLGEFARRGIERQMRYMVDALDPPPYAPARLFEFRPTEGRWFRLVWQNHKYRVFRIRTRADEERAAQYAAAAREALERGELDRAEEQALSALMLNVEDETAQQVIRHVAGLREQGFRSQP